MTHKEGFPDSRTSESNIESLIRETIFCDFVEIFQIKLNFIFFSVIELITLLIILKIVVTDVIIKRYC